LHDFEELHSEAHKVVVMNNKQKGLKSWLENKVSQRESETINLKTDFEHFEMIYSNSIDCSKKKLAIKPCENYTTLKKSSEISFENLCKVHKRKSKSGSCS